MDGLQINEKIRFGYAKAAQKLGKFYSLYRSSTSINPISNGNLVGQIKMVPTVSWDWMKANKPGNAIWYLVVDGQEATEPLSAKEADFLVGDQTFYVLSKQFQMPIQGVECNATIKIIRPYQSTSPGGQGYAGYLPPNSTLLVQGMPASILLQGRGKQAETRLPTDTNQPNWIVMMPKIGNVDIKTGDIIVDESSQQYILSATEETEFGWRFTARQTVNG